MATGWGSVLSDQQGYSYATDGVVPLPQVVDPQHLEEVVTLVDH